MNEEPLRLEQTMQPDGFVDFYSLLGITPSTPSAEVQESINALYSEAQTNRDHRVPAKRREYQTLLEILPSARLILLDEARNKRYKAYCDAVSMELPRMPYPEFLSGLVREKDVAEVRSDILTIRDISRLRAPAAEETAVEEAVTAETLEMAPVTAETEVAAEASVAAAPLMVAETPAETASAAPTTPPTTPPTPTTTSPVSEAQRFSGPAIIGGVLILAGLLVAVPILTGIPIILAIVLSVFAAGICAYVFSLTGEVIEA